jgi:hypothetical protein
MSERLETLKKARERMADDRDGFTRDAGGVVRS